MPVVEAKCPNQKKNPKCYKKAKGKREVQELFGFRRMKPDDDPIVQSYCRSCRKFDADLKRKQASKDRKAEQKLLEAAAAPKKGNRRDGKGAIPEGVIFLDGGLKPRVQTLDGQHEVRLVPLSLHERAVKYLGKGHHRVGEIVFVGRKHALYRVDENGGITAIASLAQQATA